MYNTQTSRHQNDLQALKTDHHIVKGRLRLDFVHDQTTQQTTLARCEQHPPLKVVRAFSQADGAALVHIHNLSGGILGGDQLDIAVEVAPQAQVQLTSTSATRLYRSRPDVPPAVQTNEIRVSKSGLLEYLPDPLIPFAGSRYHQHTQIELDTDAGLFWWETVAPGRTARGELFEYDSLQLDLTLSALGRPLAIERFKLEPQGHTPSSPARLGNYHSFCSFYICRVGLPASQWLNLERDLSALAEGLTLSGETIWGVSTLVAHGLVIRALSRQGKDISRGLVTLWKAAKLALYGRDAILPRKIY